MPSCTHTRELYYRPFPIFNKYWFSGYAGKGSSGRVLIAEDCCTGEHVAFKTECGTTRTPIEYRVYRKLGPISGIPRCYAAYTYKGHGVIVLERLGVTLQTLLRTSGGVLSIEQVYKVGRAMVKILQVVHDRGYVHRDVKPDNIMLPLNGALEPYLVDFGHAKPYRELEVGRHKSFGAVGTLPFMSINIHKGMRHVRRDDIVSLAYTLLYLAHGTLPWLCCTDARQCMEQKQGFRPSQLNASLPSALELFFDHAQNLDFDGQPDYSYLENQLQFDKSEF